MSYFAILCGLSLSRVLLLKLESEKAEHAAEMSELEKQIAQLKDQLNKARHGLQNQASSYLISLITS